MRTTHPPRSHRFRASLASALAAAIVALLLSGCAQTNDVFRSGTNSSPSGSAGELSGITRSPPPDVGGVVLPDVSPTLQGGSPAPMPMRAPEKQLLLVFFGYTSCPDVCPATLSHLRSAHRRLGALAADLPVAMVTVDPGRDTPEKLNAYLDHFFSYYHALRTTDTAALEAAKAAFGASSEIHPESGGGYSVSHSAGVYGVSEEGMIVIEWPFGTDGDQMATDIRLLLEQRGAK